MNEELSFCKTNVAGLWQKVGPSLTIATTGETQPIDRTAVDPTTAAPKPRGELRQRRPASWDTALPECALVRVRLALRG